MAILGLFLGYFHTIFYYFLRYTTSPWSITKFTYFGIMKILYIKSTIVLVSLWVCFFMFVIIFLVSILFILTICLSSFYAVRPFYFTPIYVFVTILYCPSCLFYPYVCHHFVLSVLFILLLCVCHHSILSILFILDHAMFVSGPQYQWQTLPAF